MVFLILLNHSEVANEVKQEEKRIQELKDEFILLNAKHHKLEFEKNEVSLRIFIIILNYKFFIIDALLFFFCITLSLQENITNYLLIRNSISRLKLSKIIMVDFKITFYLFKTCHCKHFYSFLFVYNR